MPYADSVRRSSNNPSNHASGFNNELVKTQKLEEIENFLNLPQDTAILSFINSPAIDLLNKTYGSNAMTPHVDKTNEMAVQRINSTATYKEEARIQDKANNKDLLL